MVTATCDCDRPSVRSPAWRTSRTCGRSSRSWPWRGRRPGSARARQWPCRRAGRPRAPANERCGGAITALAPSPTRWPSTTSMSASGARVRAGSTRASTSSPSSCCGCAATSPAVTEPPHVAAWLDGRQRRLAEQQTASVGAPVDAPAPAAGDDNDRLPEPSEALPDPSERARDERIEKLVGGLIELDRWLEDRLRGGLADPSIARFATWDEVARRLTDARAGALANRVRRLAGRVGSEPGWHDHVLAEIGILHLLAQAGQRVPRLPSDLADGVAVACGWQVRKADVEAVAPETDRWLVAGRSDTREDLVEVRRVWLRGIRSGAMGDGAVVRCLPPGPRRLAVGRHGRPRRPAPLSGLGPARPRGRGHRRRRDRDDDVHRGDASSGDDLGSLRAGRCRARRGAVARACPCPGHRGDHPCRRRLGAHRRHRLAADRAGVGAGRFRRHPARRVGGATDNAGGRVDSPWCRAAHRVPRRSHDRHRPACRPQLRERGVMVQLADTWDELVTVGLLGTDRRDPPELPAGLLADTVADAQRTTPQGRLLAAVAATVVAQRCGATPLPPRPLLMPPDPDDRPMLPVAAVERWQLIVSNWPVLEAEWLAVAAARGWRPAPDVLVALLRRHRRSQVLADAVLAWGGARGGVARRPRPRPRTRRQPPSRRRPAPSAASGAGRARTAAGRRCRHPGGRPRRTG